MVLGVAAAEAACRFEAWARGGTTGHFAPASKRGNVEVEREARASLQLAWRPYLYYRRLPFRGRLVNEDTTGHRVTVQASGCESACTDVYLFGGPSVWGPYETDSTTMASRLGAYLATSGLPPVRVTNFGESGYVLTQQVFQLVLQLVAGKRPAVVVFYDGVEDVKSALENGMAGESLNESDRARDFRTGQLVFSWRRDLATDVRVLLHLVHIGAGRLAVVRAFQSPSTTPACPADTCARAATRDYLGGVLWVEALAAHFHFVPVFVWMPVLDPTTKPLSPRETALFRALEPRPDFARFRAAYRLVGQEVSSPMSAVPGVQFANLTNLFSADTATLFADAEGGLTERGTEEMARNLANLLLKDVDGASRPPTPR